VSRKIIDDLIKSKCAPIFEAVPGQFDDADEEPEQNRDHHLSINIDNLLQSYQAMDIEQFSTISGFVEESPVWVPVMLADPQTNLSESSETPSSELLTTERLIIDTSATIGSTVAEANVNETTDFSSTSNIIMDAQSIASPDVNRENIQEIRQPTVIIPLDEQEAAIEALSVETAITPLRPTTSSITITRINDVQAESLKRKQIPRGSLPKRPRTELKPVIKHAPRKPPPFQEIAQETEEQPTTSGTTVGQRLSKNKVVILDYNYDSFTKNLMKQRGYDEIVTERFNVIQPEGEDYERQTRVYFNAKRLIHRNQQPTDEDKNRARRSGYVLDDDWKTQFTIQAFGGVRYVKNKVKAVATQFRRRDGVVEFQWERVDNLRAFASTAIEEYLKFVKENQRKILKI